ncbi:MAG: glycosyltransferase [Tissierellia bacterium]|nr:glycosyltransferase [Tissierellia bacterium]
MELIKRREKDVEDILLVPKEDRRLLENVPDPRELRSNVDRRGSLNKDNIDIYERMEINEAGQRYKVEYDIEIILYSKNKKKEILMGKATDISTTGILINIKDEKELERIRNSEKVRLKFKIEPGTMPEGYEMKVDIYSKLVRFQELDGKYYCGFKFDETLAEYANKHRGRYMLMFSSFLFFLISFAVIMMRTESIIYFKFNKVLYLYSIIAASFLLSRYFFGALYRPVDINPDFTPGVSIIIPCFNEEEWIERTILSSINQDYPIDKLEVIVVDDCSNDNSLEVIKNTIEKLTEEVDYYKISERVKYIGQKENLGKREALARGAKIAKHQLLVFVDSDSFLDPFAIRNLVQPFQDSKMGGVSGRTDVANTYTNNLTKMQSVRYYIAFRVMKAAEAYFDTVSCLSGPLSCYRKDLVLENMEAWLEQEFLGHKATFGDDRSMTNFILKNHRTSYQDTAICSTIVPNEHKTFLNQQMRWKRSWLRESILASKFMWKKEPFSALFFYIGVIVPVLAPVIVLYNLVYVPMVYKVFPTTFLLGMLFVALLMSSAQLFLRRSSTWAFGLYFVLYYEFILLWQMPYAWFTFWKPNWGTRMTPADIEAEKNREAWKLKLEKGIINGK